MKYVYYILSNNEKLNQLKTGVGIPNITKGTLETLKIHIPSLDRQKEIVEYCEFNDRLIQQLEKEVEQNKKQANLFISGIVKTAGCVAPLENELGEEASPTPIVEEVSNVEEEAVALVKEAPKPSKLVKKIKLKVADASEE